MDIKTADRLQALRKSHGLSQEALSEKLGVSRQAVSKWERGESSPDTDNLIALASIYNITLDDILNTEKELSNSTPVVNEKEKIENNITDNDDNEVMQMLEKRKAKVKLGKSLMKFPFAFLVVGAYVLLNLITHLWHPTWLMFLLIPIYYHYAGSCFTKTQKGHLFALPVPEIVIAVYLLLGFFANLWAQGAVVFIIIPVYYWAVAFYKK